MNQPQFVQPMGVKNALKITISGSYKKTGDGEIVDFDNIVGIMPLVDEEFAIAAARKRYAYSWIKNALNANGEKKYEKPIEHIRQVYIDDIEEIYHEFTYFGKGIKEMSDQELQDLAVEKNLREIPLPRRQSGLGMKEIRQAAYLIYEKRVLNFERDMSDRAQNNYAKWPDIIPNPIQKARPVEQQTVEDDFSEKKPKKRGRPKQAAKEDAQHVNDPSFAQPQSAHLHENDNPQDELSYLQTLANNNGVEYDWDATVEELQEKLSDAGVINN